MIHQNVSPKGYKNMQYFTVIPARGGSKGVPRKNIKFLGDFPLIYYTIDIARQCLGSEVYVSTEDDEIATICRSFGIHKIIKRPAEFAQDNSTDLGWINHAFEQVKCDNMIIMRPTTPFRCPHYILESMQHYEKHPEASGLRSAHPLTESPYKMVKAQGDYWVPFMGDSKDLEKPRQSFDVSYQPNGYIDIVKRDTLNTRTVFGDKILSFITEETIELDSLFDWERAEDFISKNACVPRFSQFQKDI